MTSLEKFYNDYAAWLSSGAAEDNKQFSRSKGLCTQAMSAAYNVKVKELKAEFAAAGLNEDYPFGGLTQFGEEVEHSIMHLNPLRIQWVMNHITQN